MTMQTLPLFSLTLSALNVRKTERDADIAALAEDIAACGLKQNLVVVPAHFSTAELAEGANYGDRFEVIAGGRRYQALRLLADEGRIEPDHPVPVLVEPRAAAQQTSLSENLHRVAMNPADEFEAFAAIVAKSVELDPIAACAKRFGVTVKHVEGRLRLAALCPEVLEALRAHEISLDSAKAYALTADHAHQLKVFKAEAKSNYSPHNPRSIREKLRGITAPLNCRNARFVGLEAYRAAGGRTETEMFMGAEGEERIVDVALLDKLAREWAEGMLPGQAKKDGFKYALLATGDSRYNLKWPATPKEMERAPGWYPDLADVLKKDRKVGVGVYQIADDGDGLQFVGHFGPVVEDDGAALAKDNADDARWAAQRRESIIAQKAARLAVGRFAGTPLEGRAFWPNHGISPLQGCRDDDQAYLVAIQIRVTGEELEAHRAAAEAELAAEEAERETEETEA